MNKSPDRRRDGLLFWECRTFGENKTRIDSIDLRKKRESDGTLQNSATNGDILDSYIENWN